MEKKRDRKTTKAAKAERKPSFEDRRSLFVREYLIDRNATQAAIRAGYSPKTAKQQGSRLLTDVDVAAQVAAATAKTFDRLEVTKERITRELAKIAFSDPRHYLTWGPEEKKVVDPLSGLVIGKTSGVSLKPSAEIDDDAAGAISEIGETQSGLKLKLHSKEAALKLLGQELGMFKEQVEHDFTSPLRLLVEAVQREAAPLPVNDPNAGRTLRRDAPQATHVEATRATTTAAPATISPLLRRPGA